MDSMSPSGGNRRWAGPAAMGLAAGVVAFGVGAAAPAASATFQNPAAITIPSSGSAAPYPSTIAVGGLSGLVSEVEVTLSGFSHTYPDDVGVLLVGPSGAAVELMDGPGAGAVSGLTLTFDDDATGPVPPTATLTSGTYQPSSYFGTPYPSPAPAGPYGAAMSVFDGTDPNGVWSLFVNDFNTADAGSISGGWSVTIDTTVVPVPSSVLLLLGGLGGLLALRRRG